MPSFEQIETLFHEALAVPECDRIEWLAGRCKGDPALLAEVSSLLAASEGSIQASYLCPCPSPK